MNRLLDVLPPTLNGLLRTVLGLPPVSRPMPVSPAEWRLYHLAVHSLGIDINLAHRLMDGGTLPPRWRYRHFAIPKRDGSPRAIVEPGPDLKAVQWHILKYYLAKPKAHPAAVGFRRKKSIADHAWAHAGAGMIITADIQDFFPNTSRQRVKRWWHEQGYSTPEIRLLTALTTYGGSLPQGAPTSPVLSNLVNNSLDATLHRRTSLTGGNYTRYADDLAFSWPVGAEPPAAFENIVRGVLREYGYRLHPIKGWQMAYRQDEPTVTGLTLTWRGSVQIPETMQRTIRDLERHPNADLTEYERQRLAGYHGYQHMVTRLPQRNRAKR